MRPWLIKTLIVIATFGACWMGAVWYWRETRRMPATDDLVVYLLVLPILLLVFAMLAIWTGRKLLAATAATATAATASAANAGADNGDSAAQAQARASQLAVIAGVLRMPHGDSAAQLADAMLERQVTLALDPELQNNHGYPILSGRIEALDASEQEQQMQDWLAAQHPAAQYGEEQWRALALGSEIAEKLSMELAPHPQLPAFLDALAAGKPLPPLPQLQLLTLMPEEWGMAERLAGADWLRHVVVRTGWPDARAAAPVLAAAGQQPLPLLSQLAQQARDTEQPLLCLVIACHSRIGADSVQAWSDQFMLFDSDHPQGRIPGEGAAGLVLGDLAQGALLAVEAPVFLHPSSNAVRKASADGKARGDTDLLAQVAAQALANAAVPATAVTILAADSDRRAGRVAELLGMASAVLPELDAASEVLSVATACGDAGAVATVAALVLAQQQVSAGAGAALCVTNLDPFHRGAVVMTGAAPVAALAEASANTDAAAVAPAPA